MVRAFASQSVDLSLISIANNTEDFENGIYKFLA